MSADEIAALRARVAALEAALAALLGHGSGYEMRSRIEDLEASREEPVGVQPSQLREAEKRANAYARKKVGLLSKRMCLAAEEESARRDSAEAETDEKLKDLADDVAWLKSTRRQGNGKSRKRPAPE